MRVLFLTTMLPHAPRTGSEVATALLVDAAERAASEVRVAGFLRQGAAAPREDRYVTIDSRPIESLSARGRASGWFARSLVTRQPYSMAKYRSRRWEERLRELGPADVAVIDHSQLGFLAPLARRCAPRVIVAFHNVEAAMYAAAAPRAGSRAISLAYRREARLMRRAERAILGAADEAWALTAADAARLTALDPSAAVRVLSLPGLSPAENGAEPSAEHDISLIGTWTWRPNQEALRWFLDDVLPRLGPGRRVAIAGAGADWLGELDPRVTYLGFVPDAQRFLRASRVVAIPSRSGGGIQIKTLDAISAGVPTVATPVSLRGIDDPPASVRVAEDAEAFAEALEAATPSPEEQRLARRWTAERRARFDAEIAAGLAGR